MHIDVTNEMKSNVVTAVFLTVLLAALGPCDTCDSQASDPKTIIVPDHYEKIQSAINAAKEFDIIHVKNGLYKEHLRINKPLRIFGEGSPVIQWNSGGHIVLIGQTYNVTFEGFILNGSGNTHWAGIRGELSTNITVTNNTIINGHRGIWFWDTQYCSFKDNHLYGNTYNLEVWGLSLSHFTHDIDESNTIEGKPVYYWVSQKNRQIPSDAGYVAIVNSSNIIVKDLSLTKSAHGVLLSHSNNCLVQNTSLSHNIRGIQVVISQNCTFIENNISDCEESGIVLTSSQNNKIINNVIKRNGWGISFSFSPLVPLTHRYDMHNIVNGNCVESNNYGVRLSESRNDTLINNVISKNEYGLQIFNSNNNSIYHNNFLDNTFQVAAFGSNSFNMWDNGYPSGGNQWSDYLGVDVKKGFYQNEPGSDGIGDTSYLIYGNVFDRYPLIPPKIDFSFQPLFPKVSDEIAFRGMLLTPNANISSWKWKMDDGSAIIGQNVTHKFEEEGNYNVSLVATDSRGAIRIIEKSVNIVGSTPEDGPVASFMLIIGAILFISIVIGYFAWKLVRGKSLNAIFSMLNYWDKYGT